jgi:4'-phosphopantetheinyl transferase
VCATPGVLDVWRADLSRVAGDALWDLLCERERERAERIVDARRRALWVRSRGALRALLARYLDRDPRALRFALGPHGKPRLQDREAGRGVRGEGSDLRFNLSHSGELMLVAVTAGREVGVDVERARERYTAEFLRAWTLREAAAKRLGAGLGAGADLGAAPLVDGAPAATRGAGEHALDAMWTTELDVGPRAFAAVALAGAGACELRLRDWPG